MDDLSPLGALGVREIHGRYHFERPLSPEELLAVSSHLVRFERGARLASSQHAKAVVQARIGHLPREVFAVLFLDTGKRVIAFETLFLGTIDQCPVYPREVARRALELNARSCVLAHNHPSGHCRPSPDDIELTKRLSETLGLFDIIVDDHLITAHDGCLSFKELSLL